MDLKLIALVIGILLTGVLLVSILIKILFKKDENEDVPNLKVNRKSQFKNFNQGSAIRSRLDLYVEKEMKYETKKKTELLLKQAGSKKTISDLYIESVLTAVVGATVIGVALKNPMAAIAFFIIGISLPKNIILLKRNKRVGVLDNQIGSFIRMTVKRYYVTNRFVEAMEAAMLDFGGQEPITSEIKQTLSEVELGTPVAEALENMSSRTQNSYMKLFANNYRVANNIGTQEMKERLLDGVINKFEKDIKLKSRLKRELSQPVLEGFLMLLIIPITFVMQSIYDREYIDFMINNPLGKIALAGVILLLGASIWLLVYKVGAPLVKEEE